MQSSGISAAFSTNGEVQKGTREYSGRKRSLLLCHCTVALESLLYRSSEWSMTGMLVLFPSAIVSLYNNGEFL